MTEYRTREWHYERAYVAISSDPPNYELAQREICLGATLALMSGEKDPNIKGLPALLRSLGHKHTSTATQVKEAAAGQVVEFMRRGKSDG